ncbi:MAG: hypothetical protein J6Q59_02340 [Paludibacteraceae bacterium]|nr:hypothetical protein [Paludibacteraceae bacterium]
MNKSALKKHPMTFAMAARLLEEEHPEIAFSAAQLQRMASKRAIPFLEIPACGTQRTYYRMVNYSSLVSCLKNFTNSPINA